MTQLLPLLLETLNVRINRVLLVAEAALPHSQFQPYRKIVLNEFGHSNGLARDIERIVADYEKGNGKESGRPIYAGKEVPHD